MEHQGAVCAFVTGYENGLLVHPKHHQKGVAQLNRLAGRDRDFHRHKAPCVFHACAACDNGCLVGRRLLERSAEPGTQTLTHHHQQILCGCATRAAQELFGRPAVVQGLVVGIDEHRRRRKTVQYQALGHGRRMAQRWCGARSNGRNAGAGLGQFGYQRQGLDACCAFALENAPFF